MTLPATDPVAESMYAERRHGLFVLALGLTGSPVIAEDVVHDVFEAVLRRRLPAEPAAAAAYLRTAVVNRCRSVHRRAAVRRRYEATLPRREQLMSGPDADEHAEVYAAVQQLSRRQREVIILRYWADLPDDEIAAVLRCSPGNVRALAFRARARLAEILELDR